LADHDSSTARAPGGTAAIIACCALALFEGFDLQAAGVAAPRLAPDLGLGPDVLGWFFSVSTFGLMLDAAVGGRLSDRYGRKPVLVASVIVFGVLSLLTGLAQTQEQLLAARFLTGVGLGGALPNLIAIVAESAGEARRGRAVGFLYAGLPCGGALASLASLAGADPSDWRMIFYIGGLGPLLVLLVAAPHLPGGTARPLPRAADVAHRKTGFLEAAVGEGRALTTFLLWTVFLLVLLIMYLLLSWLPSLLIGRGLSRPDAGLVQMAFNLAGAAGSVAAGWLMDRRGWRMATVVGVFAGAAAAVAALANAPATLVVSLLVGAALGATVSGVQSVVYGMAPTFYPTRLRGTGVGAAVVMGRLGSAIGPLLAGALLATGRSPAQVLLTLLPVLAVGGVLCVWLAGRPTAPEEA